MMKAFSTGYEAMRVTSVAAFVDSLITAAARALAASLRAWLSPSQFEQFDAEGHFDVIGSATGRKYRIQYGTSMNVYELDDTGRLKMG